MSGSRLVCTQPVFAKGASDTDQSLIGTDTSMIVENNYGYSGPSATQNGGTTAPGLARVDIDPGGQGCHTVWNSQERAPSVVPKLSLGTGLVYTYTKDPQPNGADGLPGVNGVAGGTGASSGPGAAGVATFPDHN